MQRNEQAQLLRAAMYLLYLWQQNRAELAATSAGKPVKPQDSKEESMEGAGARLDWKIETHCIARGGGGFTSRQAQALERGANCTAAKVRYDRKFERGDIGEFDTVFLNFRADLNHSCALEVQQVFVVTRNRLKSRNNGPLSHV